MRTLWITLVLLALGTPVGAQPQKLTLGIYAPSVEFGAATARLAYVKALATAIERATGLPTAAQSYATLGALTKANVDFAVLEGPCYATNLGWKLLANALVAGSTTRAWALFGSPGIDMKALRGKKLAIIATTCDDLGFVDHAMLESEVEPAFFGARVGKQDLTAAIAEVASYKTAHAVFAPVGAAKGLTKVFDTGVVPNPAFVALGSRLSAGTLDKVAAAVIGYRGGGAISGWTKPSREIYTAFAGRLGRVAKAGILAVPELVQLDARAALIEPPTLNDSALVDVRHLFVRAPGDRMQ